MRLSAKTKYGVRAVFDIAYHSQDEPGVAIQAKDVALREQIPLRYLEQIFQDLRRAGILESKRGPRGGYLLKRRPEDLSLAEIVAVLQGPLRELFALREDGADETSPASHGVTSALWDDLSSVLTNWFDNVSVADLVEKGNILGLSKASAAPMYFI
ncbi:MAG: Rrf2 family transcriptional regulator [Myxococcales bacterium]|nr:Rrf2 family transcriptional regulator [Myxococcales bacterium]